MIGSIFSALMLGLGLMSSVPAAAQQQIGVRVRYDDLDLTSRSGTQALHHRLETAITAVCGEFDAQDSVRTGAVNACRDATRLTIADMERKAIAAAGHQAMLASAQDKGPSVGP